MCGVIFARRRDKHPVKKALLKRYSAQAARGKQGYGFLEIEKGRVKEVQRFETESEAEKAVNESNSAEILFHHRMPTSTPNHKDVTHPIVVSNKELEHDYYVIHNGVLRNEDELREKHENLGYEYTTVMQDIRIIKTKKRKKETIVEVFNDSESLAIELARFLDGKDEKLGFTGSAAFICLKTDKKGNVVSLHYGHNSGNPLIVENNGDLLFIKSQGDGEKVPEDVLFSVDYKTGQETTQVVSIGRKYFPTPTTSEKRSAGFGRQDDESPTRFAPPPANVPARNDSLFSIGKVREGKFEFDDNDLPWQGTDLPVIHADDDFHSVPRYEDSETYLSDLLDEIQTLERDMKSIGVELEKPQSTEDRQVYEDMLEETKTVMSKKKGEYTRLEDKLAGRGY